MPFLLIAVKNKAKRLLESMPLFRIYSAMATFSSELAFVFRAGVASPFAFKMKAK